MVVGDYESCESSLPNIKQRFSMGKEALFRKKKYSYDESPDPNEYAPRLNES